MSLCLPKGLSGWQKGDNRSFKWQFCSQQRKKSQPQFWDKDCKPKEYDQKRIWCCQLRNRLDGDFGPAVTTGDVEALVTSTETQIKGKVLNEMRAKIGVKPVKVITVELVKAEDGSKISSTRIRTGEIDRQGRILVWRKPSKDALFSLNYGPRRSRTILRHL